jgi:hypothetical protein
MIRVTLFLFSVILVSACSDRLVSNNKPKNLIPRDSMVMVLKEMTLLEAHIQTKYMHVSRFKETMLLSGKKLLEKHHISSQRYEESMAYYGARQDEMQSIYSEILDSLNQMATMKETTILPKDSVFSSIPPKKVGFSPRNRIVKQ